jgi:hypothetical protein
MTKKFSEQLTEAIQKEALEKKEDMKYFVPYAPLDCLYDEWFDWWDGTPNKDSIFAQSRNK